MSTLRNDTFVTDADVFTARDRATAERHGCADKPLTSAHVTLADAAVMLRRYGLTIPAASDDGWYRGDNGHANACPRDGSTKCGASTCRMLRSGLLPADWFARPHGFRVRFTCGGCGQERTLATRDDDHRDGFRTNAQRAHMVARGVFRNETGWGVRTYHEAVTRLRCPACHDAHGDASVIVPADLLD